MKERGDVNVKPLLWIFHQLPWGTHQAITLRERTHQDLVEEVVKAEMNINFSETVEPYNHKKRNCIQQIYTLCLNNRKQDIMRKRYGNLRDLQGFIKYKGDVTEGKKNRSKTILYWTCKDSEGRHQMHKVRLWGSKELLVLLRF